MAHSAQTVHFLPDGTTTSSSKRSSAKNKEKDERRDRRSFRDESSGNQDERNEASSSRGYDDTETRDRGSSHHSSPDPSEIKSSRSSRKGQDKRRHGSVDSREENDDTKDGRNEALSSGRYDDYTKTRDRSSRGSPDASPSYPSEKKVSGSSPKGLNTRRHGSVDGYRDYTDDDKGGGNGASSSERFDEDKTAGTPSADSPNAHSSEQQQKDSLRNSHKGKSGERRYHKEGDSDGSDAMYAKVVPRLREKHGDKQGNDRSKHKARPISGTFHVREEMDATPIEQGERNKAPALRRYDEDTRAQDRRASEGSSVAHSFEQQQNNSLRNPLKEQNTKWYDSIESNREDTDDIRSGRNQAPSSERLDKDNTARGMSSSESPDALSSGQQRKEPWMEGKSDYQESYTDDNDDSRYATITDPLPREKYGDKNGNERSTPESSPSEQRPNDQKLTGLRGPEVSQVTPEEQPRAQQIYPTGTSSQANSFDQQHHTQNPGEERQGADLTPLNFQSDKSNNLSCGQTENVAQSDRVENSENTGEGISGGYRPKSNEDQHGMKNPDDDVSQGEVDKDKSKQGKKSKGDKKKEKKNAKQKQEAGGSDAHDTKRKKSSRGNHSPGDESSDQTPDEQSQDSFVEDVGAILKDLFRAEPTGEQHGQQVKCDSGMTDDASHFLIEADIDKLLKTIQFNIEDYDKKVKSKLPSLSMLRGDHIKNIHKDWTDVKRLVASSAYRFNEMLTAQNRTLVDTNNTLIEEKCTLDKALQHEKRTRETEILKYEEQKKQIENKLANLETEHEKVRGELSQHKQMIATQKQKAEERKNQLKRDLEDADQTVDRLRQQRNQHREENERLRRERNQLRTNCEKWAPSFDRPMNIILPESILGNSRVNDLVHQLLRDLGEFVKVGEHYKDLSRLKPKDPGTIVVPCVAASRVESDICATLEAHPLGQYVQMVLILYHHITPEKGRASTSTMRSNMRYNYPQCLQIIDAYFWNDDFYDCRINREAVDTLLNICQAHVLLGK